MPQAGGRVVGVGVSGIGPCVVPVDAHGSPLRPAILYGIDTRAEREVAELTDILGADMVLERCGSLLSSQALGPKLRWLWRHEPAVWEGMRRWHMASSLVVERLTGEWVLDHQSASQCDPLYDLDTCSWADDWADAVAPGLPLPRLAWAGDVVGAVTGHAAELTGLPEGVPVVAGTVDAWAEAVSVDVRRAGELMLMYGSTMFLLAGADERPSAPALWTTRGVDPGSLSIAAGMATSGTVAEWARELLGGVPFGTLVDEARALSAGSDGLVALFLTSTASEPRSRIRAHAER
jgi:xylulokinase